jgi:hypothetical protein
MDRINADNLALALQQVIGQRPDIMRRFYQSFRFRARMLDLPEAGSIEKALDRILAGLLSSTFDPCNTELTSDSEVLEVPKAFLETLLSVAGQLQTTHPIALVMFAKHLASHSCTVEQALVSLFALYVRNQSVYPY